MTRIVNRTRSAPPSGEATRPPNGRGSVHSAPMPRPPNGQGGVSLIRHSAGMPRLRVGRLDQTNRINLANLAGAARAVPLLNRLSERAQAGFHAHRNFVADRGYLELLVDWLEQNHPEALSQIEMRWNVPQDQLFRQRDDGEMTPQEIRRWRVDLNAFVALESMNLTGTQRDRADLSAFDRYQSHLVAQGRPPLDRATFLADPRHPDRTDPEFIRILNLQRRIVVLEGLLPARSLPQLEARRADIQTPAEAEAWESVALDSVYQYLSPGAHLQDPLDIPLELHLQALDFLKEALSLHAIVAYRSSYRELTQEQKIAVCQSIVLDLGLT